MRLTMLGMIIGVSAVITLVALGNGARMVVEEQITNGGANQVTVNPGSTNQGGARGGTGTASSLTVEDAAAIRAEIPGVRYLAIGVRSQQQIVAGNRNWPTRVQGTDVDLAVDSRLDRG
jgi:putative ABC transport system permease protein